MGHGRNGRAQPRNTQSTKNKGRAVAVATQPLVDPDAWMLDVDLSAPLSPEHRFRVYRLDAPMCTATIGSHGGERCSVSRECLVGFFRQDTSEADSKAAIEAALNRRDRAREPVDVDDACAPGAAAAPATPLPPLRQVGAPAGLRNLANTCYLNSVLQLLLRCPRLVQQVLQSSTPRLAGGLDDYSIPLLLARLHATTAAWVDPSTMVKALKLDVHLQQDAQEFLALFLTLLEDTNPTLATFIQKELCGHMLYTRTCSACGAVSKKTDKFLFLTVPVLPGATVAECVQKSLEPDTLHGATCEKCRATNVSLHSTVALKTLPRTLIVHFMRFQYDVAKGERVKVRDAVELSESVPVTSLRGDSRAGTAAESSDNYVLTAVLNHHGDTPANGHYTTHASTRAVTANAAGPMVERNDPSVDGWFQHDDDVVAAKSKPVDTRDSDTAGVRTRRTIQRCTTSEAYLAMFELTSSEAAAGADGPLATLGEPALVPLSIPAHLQMELATEGAALAEAHAHRAVVKSQLEEEAEVWRSVCASVFASHTNNKTRGANAPPSRALVSAADLAASLAISPKYAISDGWLSRYAAGDLLGVDSSDRSARSISCTDVLCAHGQLDPTKGFRVLNASQWELLYATQGCDRPLRLSEELLCRECTAAVIRTRQHTSQAQVVWNELLAKLKQGSKNLSSSRGEVVVEDSCEDNNEVLEMPSVEYLSTTALDTVLDATEPPEMGMNDVPIDLTAALLCPHGGIRPNAAKTIVSSSLADTLVEQYGYLRDVRLPASRAEEDGAVCAICMTEQRSAVTSINATKLRKFAIQKDLESVRRASEECNKTVLSRNLRHLTKKHTDEWEAARKQTAAEEAKRRQEEEAAEKAATRALPVTIVVKRGGRGGARGRAPAVQHHEDPAAATPQAASTAEVSAPPSAAEGDSSPADEAPPTCPDRRVALCALPAAWVAQVSDWLADQSHLTAPPPGPPTWDDWRCPHGGSLYSVDDFRRNKRPTGPIGVLLSRDEYSAVARHFLAVPELPSSDGEERFCTPFEVVELNDTRVMQPPVCEGCLAEREAAEQTAFRQYEAGILHFDGKLKKSKKNRVEVAFAVPELSHMTTLAELRQLVSTQLGQLYELFVAPADVQLLKGKTQLDDDSQTLSGMGICNGDTLHIDTGDAIWKAGAVPPRAAEEWQQVPVELLSPSHTEAAFGGSALSGRVSGPDASASTTAAVVACPLCTFENPAGRHVCEMCETLLPR